MKNGRKKQRAFIFLFQRITKAKPNLLFVLLDVTDVVTTHCTRAHMTDEGKQLIF